ncbi:MAG: hypothetical protein EZS28_048180, partial [Streblomastix strix]
MNQWMEGSGDIEVGQVRIGKGSKAGKSQIGIVLNGQNSEFQRERRFNLNKTAQADANSSRASIVLSLNENGLKQENDLEKKAAQLSPVIE